jgi:hypothetical protein
MSLLPPAAGEAEPGEASPRLVGTALWDMTGVALIRMVSDQTWCCKRNSLWVPSLGVRS